MKISKTLIFWCLADTLAYRYGERRKKNTYTPYGEYILSSRKFSNKKGSIDCSLKKNLYHQGHFWQIENKIKFLVVTSDAENGQNIAYDFKLNLSLYILK